MLVIDGSEGEGGGQVLRTALALSAATGKQCRVVNIRAKRPKPGLMAQHLASVLALQRFCGAEVKGAWVGSPEVEFAPQELAGGELAVDIGTAGSVTLVAQALLPAIVHARKAVTLELTGGTHVTFAPTTSYLEHVLAYWLGRMGVRLEVEAERAGFYPKGGGKVRVRVAPGKLKPLVAVERGAERERWVESIAAQELARAKVAERQLQACERSFGTAFLGRRGSRKGVARYAETACAGSAVLAVARFDRAVLGESALGAPGKRAETVGKEAGEALAKAVASGACIDRHMADQLLPLLAMAGGRSEIAVAEVTEHARTNAKVVECFLPARFEFGAGRIAVEG